MQNAPLKRGFFVARQKEIRHRRRDHPQAAAPGEHTDVAAIHRQLVVAAPADQVAQRPSGGDRHHVIRPCVDVEDRHAPAAQVDPVFVKLQRPALQPVLAVTRREELQPGPARLIRVIRLPFEQPQQSPMTGPAEQLGYRRARGTGRSKWPQQGEQPGKYPTRQVAVGGQQILRLDAARHAGQWIARSMKVDRRHQGRQPVDRPWRQAGKTQGQHASLADADQVDRNTPVALAHLLQRRQQVTVYVVGQ